ncbi:MAG TPA: GNAT family N-acetyltransferase, partial [Actinomycetes bacterium]
PEFWGLGFATEAAQGALRYAREQTGLRELIALVLPTNERSAAVLARLGFRHDGVLELPDASWKLCRRSLDRL